jgi:predicted short-subunit dehydrogenase-like oxidoreductase (DUF2520 family)
MTSGQRRAGLISAGGVAQSFLVRLPLLLAGVGPVKAASIRVARRLSNTLRAGHAVDQYSDLEKCRLIWIAVPDASLDRVARDMVLQIVMPGKMIVLCGSDFDSLRPGPLRTAGARIATMNVMYGGSGALIAEGHSAVMRELRRMATAEKRKLIEIEPGMKSLYLAAVQLSTRLVLPWIAAALESFRAAGFSRADAADAAEHLGRRALHSYCKAGRKAWSAAASAELRGSLARDLETIREADASLAALYASGIAQALRYFDAEQLSKAAIRGGTQARN